MLRGGGYLELTLFSGTKYSKLDLILNERARKRLIVRLIMLF